LHARNRPGKVALRARGRSYTFGELDALLDRVAASLRRGGVGRGEAAAAMLGNRPEFLALPYALGRLGASAVTDSWRSTPAELGHVLGDSGARWLFADAEAVGAVEAARGRLGGGRVVTVGAAVGGGPGFDEFARGATGDGPVDDDASGGAVVMYTSGTTGRPKGAVRTFPRDALARTLRFLEAPPLRHDDVHSAACPLYQATAYAFVNLTQPPGGTAALGDEFDPAAFAGAVRRPGVTQTAIVPTMLYRLVEAARRGEVAAGSLRTLRAVFVGGAPLAPALVAAARGALGDALYRFYGATETGTSSPSRRPTTCARRRAPSGGRCGATTCGCSTGRAGRWPRARWASSTSPPLRTFDAYPDDAVATATGRRGRHVWAGDLGRRDAKGALFLAGRAREVIPSGGVNAYPAEVEAALTEHEGVAEAAVVGVLDDERGERVRAYVVAREGARLDAASVVAHCRARVSGAKVPREVASSGRYRARPRAR
jgi:fatty-acyl-CoA synthase